MKTLLLIPLLFLAGCVYAPAPVTAKKVTVTTQVEGQAPSTQTYYVVPSPYYGPTVQWSIGVGIGRGHYRPGPWRHHRHW